LVHLTATLGNEERLAGKSIVYGSVPSAVLAIGRCANPCAGQAGATAPDTARRSYRRSWSGCVIAATAATAPCAYFAITRTRFDEQGAGPDK
jgi:hypothetical protein